MSIFAIIDNLDKELVEYQAIFFLQTITFYFPVPELASADVVLNVITALISFKEITRLSTALAEIQSFRSPEGEYSILSLRTALTSKRAIQDSSLGSLDDEIALLTNPYKRSKQQIASDSSLHILEQARDIVKLIRADSHYPYILEFIVQESLLMQRIRQIKNAKVSMKEEEILYSVLDASRTFRRNENQLDKFIIHLESIYKESRAIPHTSFIGKSLGFFVRKLATTSQLVWDQLQFLKKMRHNLVDDPLAIRRAVRS